MTTFPLFHLPLVAMEHVLCMMNPCELIDLSGVSTRVHRTVASFSRTKSKFQVVIAFTEERRISISVGDECWTLRWTEKKSEVDKNVSETNQFSKHLPKILMGAYNYIKDVLKCQLHLVYFHLDSFPNQNKLITDWLGVQAIDNIKIGNVDEETNDDLKYLGSNITVKEKFMLTTSDYKDDFQMEIPTMSSEILITNSRFINFEQFLRLKNPHIAFFRSLVTDQELNKFLKSWMACKSHLSLEAFEINVSGPEAMEIIMDLPHEETADENAEETFKKKFNNPVVENWFDIKRCDGNVATVGFRYDKHRFFMLTR
uniref:F-box domain-containing protein n=1 Tax=Caenorhabditis tropicalis TaxID=1561998 RepID=A0A1I7TUN8_9PELO